MTHIKKKKDKDDLQVKSIDIIDVRYKLVPNLMGDII